MLPKESLSGLTSRMPYVPYVLNHIDSLLMVWDNEPKMSLASVAAGISMAEMA